MGIAEKIRNYFKLIGGGANQPTDLHAHDLKYHNGHFDPDTMTCGKREEMSKEDPIDTGVDDINEKRDSFQKAVREIFWQYKQNGFTEKTISAMDALDNMVERGDMVPMRMPANAMKTSGATSVPKWFRSLYHLLCYYNTKSSGLPEDEARIVRDYAKARGKWSDDVDGVLKERFGDPFAHGAESNVYDGGDCVIKAFGDNMDSENFTEVMERIMLGNHYFPEAKYDILGFGMVSTITPYGTVTSPRMGIALKQRKFELSHQMMSEKEISEYMEKRGFVRDRNDNLFFTSYITADNNVQIEDAHGGNVVRVAGGQVVGLDLYCHFDVDNYDFNNPPATLG